MPTIEIALQGPAPRRWFVHIGCGSPVRSRGGGHGDRYACSISGVRLLCG
jgi:hypothetical protein